VSLRECGAIRALKEITLTQQRIVCKLASAGGEGDSDG
jgi:hypothetical protein